MNRLPKLKPIPMKDRASVIFVEKGRIDVIDGAFVVVDKEGTRTQIPVGSIGCLMLEPGTRVSHEAVKLAARVGCLLTWVGEAGVRLYSAGMPGGARTDRLLRQAQIALHPQARERVVRKMFSLRFGEDPPERYGIEQLRGMEGARVKRLYKELARTYGIVWRGRRYDPNAWGKGDMPNRCLSAATASLYGVTEAAILAAGYSPAIGFLHTGKPRSFVYDIADLFKFETVVPAAFEVAARGPTNPEQEVRHACRDHFRSTRLLDRIIPTIVDVLQAGDLPEFELPEWALGPAFEEE